MSRVTVCLVTPIESAASSTERRLSFFSETIYLNILSIWKIFQTILSQSGFSAVVEATQRIEFMKTYIGGLKKAVEEGIPVLGYLYWSIIDNFEWAEGYDKRFGLVHVDYRTQERTVKDSGYWYADLIRENGESLPATLHLDGRLG